jgi:hypothetical protein
MHVELQRLQSQGKGVGSLFLPPAFPFLGERGVSASAGAAAATAAGGGGGVDRGTEGELGAAFVLTTDERRRRRI